MSQEVSRTAPARSGARRQSLATRAPLSRRRPVAWCLTLATAALALLSWPAGRAHAAPPVDAEKPAAAAPPADAWPLAVVDRPLTLPRGMAGVALSSASYWGPSTAERSYFGPSAGFAVHDRVQLGGGLPFAMCWDLGSNGCTGGSSLDHAYLDVQFALRRRAGFSLAAGVVASIERYRAPFENSTSLWLTGKRTWFHRLALLGSAELSVGWQHPQTERAIMTGFQENQTRLYWTEEVQFQVIESLALFAYGNPYRPLGAPGDESWATRVGGGVTLAFGPRWLLSASCAIENVMPVRAWQYVPHATECFASAFVYHLPE